MQKERLAAARSHHMKKSLRQGLFLHPLVEISQIPQKCNGTYVAVAPDGDFLPAMWELFHINLKILSLTF